MRNSGEDIPPLPLQPLRDFRFLFERGYPASHRAPGEIQGLFLCGGEIQKLKRGYLRKELGSCDDIFVSGQDLTPAPGTFFILRTKKEPLEPAGFLLPWAMPDQNDKGRPHRAALRLFLSPLQMSKCQDSEGFSKHYKNKEVP
jgi:hypothetical protein